MTAVICAYNNRNPGMYTVDLSARSFFRGTRYELFQVEPLRRFGKIRYRPLQRVEDLRAFRNVVFWGDFPHNPIWGARDFAERRLKQAKAPDLESARSEWVSLYLRTREAVGKDVTLVSAGTCFLGADGEEHLGRYGDDLRYLLASFDLVVSRDPLSSEVARRLARGPNGHGATSPKGAAIVDGVDPVFLGDYLPAAAGVSRRRFGFFFHRSRLNGTEGLVRAVAARSGLTAVPLTWFGLKNGWLAHWRYQRLIRSILSCDFILTDVYHMAATSLKMHVPVVALGRAETVQASTLSDVKKKALFKGVDGEDWYVETVHDEVRPDLSAAVLDRVGRIRGERGLDRRVRQAVRDKSQSIRRHLRAALALR